MAPPKGGGMRALAAMCSHVPNKGEQMVRYYGHYSNVSRGKRKKQDQDGMILSILEPDGSSIARPGATRLPIVGLDYALFQT